MADKAAATKAAAARKELAVVDAAAAADAAAKKKDGEEEAEAEEPASKKQRRAAAAGDEEREGSPEVVVGVGVVPAATEEEVGDGASSRESSPEAPVTPDVSGMEEEGGEEGDADAETSTAETATTATTTEGENAAAAEDDTDKELDPARFSHISDRAYSPQDVVDATAALVAALPAQLRTRAPNAKMFLRSFWYRAVAGGALSSSPRSSSSSDSSSSSSPSSLDGGDRMHVYTLASFFLQLSLLDQESSEVAPSAAAAGALSLALEVFSSPKASSSSSSPAPAPSAFWPACLQRYSGIDAAAAALQRERLRRVQREAAAPHLRAVWASRHEQHGYPEFAEEWALALRAMKEAGEV